MLDCARMATKKSAQAIKVSRLRATKLPPRDAAQVARIAAQFKPARASFTRRRNVLLFSGARAALGAQALAKELGRDLYRVDLSAVVSKFIGDTEKNLRRIFDGAEESGAVLFLDEADALFDKRTDVKDSHDRFSNVEVNYLLQRLEAFAGLAILAVSRKANINPAFLLRLRIHEFPPTR
jgi:SpoVK/Ycf46/Vps4 family AAA+-type ATPase